MRFGVLASGAGTNLQALIDRVHARRDSASGSELVAVGSDRPQARALERARAASVAMRAFPAADYSDRAARDRAMAAWLRERGAELVVLAGYMQLLSGEFLRSFPAGVINVHPALLPAFPGLRALEQALDYGVRITGVTVHFVDEGIDTGPVILQRAVPVEAGDDLESLSARVHAVEHELLPEAVELIAAGRVRLAAGRVRLAGDSPRRVAIDR